MHHDIVEIHPDLPRKGHEATISYNGILARDGADSIWMHYGFDDWKNTSTRQMQREGDRFVGNLKVEGKQNINLCFKDSADHWDNNNGMNWNYKVK